MSISENLFNILTNDSNNQVHKIDVNICNFKLSNAKLYYPNKNKINDYIIVTLENIDVYEIIKKYLPSNLKKLYIKNYCTNFYGFNLDNLPIGLEKLKLSDVDLRTDNLPTGLYFLEILGKYTQNLDNLPCSLKILILENYAKNLDNIPSSLESLVILCKYSLPIKNLPIGLKNFVFIDCINSDINLPSNIQNVWFDESNNKLRRRLIKINPKVCYFDHKKSFWYTDIEIFDNIVISVNNDKDYESDNYDSDDSDDYDDSDDFDDSNYLNY